jgi:hypothetical protein
MTEELRPDLQQSFTLNLVGLRSNFQAPDSKSINYRSPNANPQRQVIKHQEKPSINTEYKVKHQVAAFTGNTRLIQFQFMAAQDEGLLKPLG